MNILYVLIVFIFFINNCTQQTTYSGKILELSNLDNINFENKESLVDKLGSPSYIDPISNKFFYYSEKQQKKSIFNKKTDYSYIFVFEFDREDKIIYSKVFDLTNRQNIDLIKEETSSEIIKRGLLEKIFGGVGPDTNLPTSP
tara:strand:+ start:353 stop:781 length:429 start_codon:yes stop_codon:yes gene_type:complete